MSAQRWFVSMNSYEGRNSMNNLPKTQYAVQLVGPSKLILNKEKEVYQPNPYQIVAKIEAVGLCFSDLKLLKQFTEHPRKGPIVSGISQDILKEIPSYKINEEPTVPGHEAVCRIVALGDKVKNHTVGQRCLVQTDYRWLRTAKSNAAFGYNFEGALQQYVLMDERIITDPQTGESLLIPVNDELSASAVCLVEPWACVEDSYISPERKTIKSGGNLLIVTDKNHKPIGIEKLLNSNPPANTVKLTTNDNLNDLPDENFDDIIYFGSNPQIIEILNDKLDAKGIINIVLSGEKIEHDVTVSIGRVHYGMIRFIGTTGDDASESYKYIPDTGEIRSGDRILISGAAGPMGQMHVIRNICSGIANIEIIATDLDDTRLQTLSSKTAVLAEQNNINLQIVNPKKTPIAGSFDYFAIMVPVAPMVADAINISSENAIINIFAGIPAGTKHPVNLNKYIENHCYMFGTSGSVIRDMKIVLEKINSGQLDTNISVDAISGMAGAIDGLAAVENRTLAGKIVVYPQLTDLPLIPLSQLDKHLPAVADKLDNGKWTKSAEDELLK